MKRILIAVLLPVLGLALYYESRMAFVTRLIDKAKTHPGLFLLIGTVAVLMCGAIAFPIYLDIKQKEGDKSV